MLRLVINPRIRKSNWCSTSSPYLQL